MRKILIVLVALSLTGCAGLGNIGTIIPLVTTSIANPVTPERLEQLEKVTTLVFVGLKTWKSACQRGAIPATCRSQVAAVQVYTRQIPPYLVALRDFVKHNDQVNAIDVFNKVSDIITSVKSQAASAGRPIEGV